MTLPPKVIQGSSVRDYAYQWIVGACALHQWCSGARGIDDGVITHVKTLMLHKTDVQGLTELLEYLQENKGAPAESYVPDQWQTVTP